MVLQSLGPIKLSEIQTEFGGTNPISLSEYYSNAASKYTSGVSGIPNIGSLIKLSNFMEKVNLVILYGNFLIIVIVVVVNMQVELLLIKVQLQNKILKIMLLIILHI